MCLEYSVARKCMVSSDFCYLKLSARLWSNIQEKESLHAVVAHILFDKVFFSLFVSCIKPRDL